MDEFSGYIDPLDVDFEYQEYDDEDLFAEFPISIEHDVITDDASEGEGTFLSVGDALPLQLPLEPPGMPEPPRLDEYDRDYPDRDDPDIQSLITAKSEFAECKSGPNPMKDVRVDSRFFNNQVFYQRLMTAYGSCALFAEMGSGKTGCIECFRSYMEKFRPGTVSRYFYVTNEVQQLEFKYQITESFATEVVRAKFIAAATKQGLNYRQILRDQKKVAKDYLTEKMIETQAYLYMSDYIDSMDNDMLIKTFGRAAVFVDEVQFIKITEDVDTSVLPRPAKPVAGVRYERQRMKVYKSFWRLTHVCPNCYFSPMTGRPMTKDYNELKYILNLLPNTTQIDTPLSRQIAQSMADLRPERRVEMPTKWAKVDLSSAKRTEQLEAVARGRIMYIRAPDTGAFKDYDASSDSRHVGYFEEVGRTVTLVTMHAFQARTYLKAHNEMMAARDKSVARKRADPRIRKQQDTLHHSARQSLVFAIPSEEYMYLRTRNPPTAYDDIDPIVRQGYIGKEHLHQIADVRIETYERVNITEAYVKKKIKRGDITMLTREVWTPKEVFNKCVRTDMLAEFSAKFFDLVTQLESEKEGMAYAASQYDATTGGILGWILEARGFERFRPVGLQWISSTGQFLIPKKPRYAPMTSDNDDEHQGILALARHPGNWKGEYLRFIMASPVTTVGVNVGNCWRLALTDPLATDADMEQATARVFRPNAHREIMNQLNTDKFGVKVVYYISEMPDIPEIREHNPDGSYSLDASTIDWNLYQRIALDGREVAKVSRAYKRISIDFPVNIERNIRPNDEPGSPEVDYLSNTRYGPYRTFRRLPMDTSTYDAYYAKNSLSKVVSALTNTLSSMDFAAVNIATILNLFSSYINASFSRTEMLFGIRYIIEHRLPLGRSRLGFPVYLEENEGTLYSTTSLNRENDKMLSYYYPLNTILQDTTLERQSYDLIDISTLQSDIDAIERGALEKVRTDLLSIPSAVKGKLFELASTERVSEAWSAKIMEALYPLWVKVNGVIVHQITNLFYKGSNANAVEFILKANTSLRIYSKGVWRWCNPGETETYSRLLNAKLEEQMQPYYRKFAAAGFIGLIIRPDDIHIRNVIADEATGEVHGGRGKRVSGFALQDLASMLYDMGCARTPSYRLARTPMIIEIKKGFKGISTMMLNSFSDDKLSFFYQKSIEFQGNKNNVARVSLDLCECMAGKKAIYALVGTVVNTLNRMSATPPREEAEEIEEEGDPYDFGDESD